MSTTCDCAQCRKPMCDCDQCKKGEFMQRSFYYVCLLPQCSQAFRSHRPLAPGDRLCGMCRLRRLRGEPTVTPLLDFWKRKKGSSEKPE